MVVSHSIVMPTVEYAFAPRHLKLYAYKTPSRHVLKHTITKAFFLKNGTLIKPFIAHLFQAKKSIGFFGKIVSQKSPSLPDEKQQPYKGFTRSKICTLIKPKTARLSDGSGAAQYSLKTSRSKFLSATQEYFFCACTSLSKGKLHLTHFQVWQKSIGDISTYTLVLYLVFSILSIKYKHTFVIHRLKFNQNRILLDFLSSKIYYLSNFTNAKIIF